MRTRLEKDNTDCFLGSRSPQRPQDVLGRNNRASLNGVRVPNTVRLSAAGDGAGYPTDVVLNRR